MKVSVTEYRNLAYSANGVEVQYVGEVSQRGASNFTAAGSLVLQPGTKLVRVATDTSIMLNPTGSGAAELVPANTAEIFSVIGGSTLSFA